MILVLYCKGCFRDVSFPMEGSISRADWEAYVGRINNFKRRLMAKLPDHYDLVTAIRAAAEEADNRHVIPPAIAALAAASRATVPLPDWGGEAAAA